MDQQRATEVDADIARFLAEIEAEYRAALDERARLPEGERHAAVSRRMENMSRIYEHLRMVAGANALPLVVERLGALSAATPENRESVYHGERAACTALRAVSN